MLVQWTYFKPTSVPDFDRKYLHSILPGKLPVWYLKHWILVEVVDWNRNFTEHIISYHVITSLWSHNKEQFITHPIFRFPFTLTPFLRVSFEAIGAYHLFLYQGIITHMWYNFSTRPIFLKIFHIDHQYTNFNSTKCDLMTYLKYNYSSCFNITSERSQLNYIFFKAPVIVTFAPHYLVKELSVSWNEASAICKRVGGYLPILRNKDEIEKFTSLVKSTFLPFIEIIFIGLKSVKVNIFVRNNIYLLA